eukprot:scaffold8028_cov165-Amphora_coffeaeformis.AAC.5
MLNEEATQFLLRCNGGIVCQQRPPIYLTHAKSLFSAHERERRWWNDELAATTMKRDVKLVFASRHQICGCPSCGVLLQYNIISNAREIRRTRITVQHSL